MYLQHLLVQQMLVPDVDVLTIPFVPPPPCVATYCPAVTVSALGNV